MYVVILGCGRVGAALASALDAAHEVIVIDWNSRSFTRLPQTFRGETVLGNGIDVDCLRAADVGRADAFLAVTDGDNRNLMAGQVAKHLGAKQVIARVYDAERSQIFTEPGLTTFSPTVAGSDRLYSLVLEEMEE